LGEHEVAEGLRPGWWPGDVGIGGCDGDDEAVLGRHQNVAVACPVHDRLFQGADRRLGVAQRPGGRGERDLVGSRHVEPEGLGSYDESAHVGVAAQQVLDELPAQGFLPSRHLSAGVGVALGQAGDGFVDDVEHCRGGVADGLAVPGSNDHG
jgi:hypothetical protein